MALDGMLRADTVDLATLDEHLAGSANGVASNGSDAIGQQSGRKEIEEVRPTPDDLRGANTADWEIDMSQVMCINLLASGAFGKVFYGLYQQKEDVAVKLMNLPPTMSAKEVAGLKSSFKQEIAVWHRLKHKNIVQFMGASLDARSIVAPPDALPPRGQPVWAIVTEYMPGGTLRAYLAKRRARRLALKDTVRIALDVARGLEYLHSQNVVHRDLKSDNLLLDHNGVVKVADFGVARTEAKNPVDMTCETGTVRWMAPEVINHKPYTRKVDVYSFGIVLWELCTCELPFKDLSFVQLAFNVVNKGQRPTIPETCNPTLAKLMQQCWDPNPDARPEFGVIVPQLEAMQGEDRNGGSEEAATAGCTCALL